MMSTKFSVLTPLHDAHPISELRGGGNYWSSLGIPLHWRPSSVVPIQAGRSMEEGEKGQWEASEHWQPNTETLYKVWKGI